MPEPGDPLPELDELDGPHTPGTLGIASRLKASGYNLDRWWVLTPQDWSCPCCNRSKQSIARLDATGRLYGHLMAHHDHVSDLVVSLFLEIAASRNWPEVNSRAEEFAKRMSQFVSAHDPTVICSDCNEADAQAKKLIDAPFAFSFAPADITRFIRTAPNRSHHVDVGVLTDLWSRRFPLFERRAKMIRRLVEFALSEEHWFQPSAFRDQPQFIELKAAVILEAHDLRTSGFDRGTDRVAAYVEAASTRMVSGKTAKTWRGHKDRQLGQPPDEAAVAAVAGLSTFWKSVPEDWTCPCCGRHKRDVIQPSGSRKLSFTTDTRRIYGDGPRGEKAVCCRECSWVVSNLAREVGVEHYWVSFEDVRKVIVPRRNGSHFLRSDAEVDAVIAEVADRQSDRISDAWSDASWD